MMLTCAVCGNQSVLAHFPASDNQRFNYTRLIVAPCHLCNDNLSAEKILELMNKRVRKL